MNTWRFFEDKVHKFADNSGNVKLKIEFEEHYTVPPIKKLC